MNPAKRRGADGVVMTLGTTPAGSFNRIITVVDTPKRPVWLLLVLVVLSEFALPDAPPPDLLLVLDGLHLLLLGLLGLSVCVNLLTVRQDVVRRHGVDVLMFAAALAVLGFANARAAGLVVILRFLFRGGVTFSRTPTGARALNRILERPARALILSFAVIIAVGTLLLMLPASLVVHDGPELLVAAFTATSATCVTGLSVVDIGTHYTRFGQWVVLLLIQAGGLGIITIGTALAVALRRGLSRRLHSAVQEMMEAETTDELRTLLLGVVTVTLAAEVLGAACLYPWMEMGADGQVLARDDRVFFAVFHAVSAWCNAGFALYPDSLVRYVDSVPVNVVVVTLLVMGGIGGTVLMEFLGGRWLAHGPRLAWAFLSLHTKLALVTSGALLLFSTLVFSVLERPGSMQDMDVGTWWLASFFQGASLRTAGFASVDMARVSPPTALLSMALMFVGGSPGGTAGGVKTTTLALMVLAVRAMLRGRRDLEAFGRAIPPAQVYRAISVVALSGLLLGALTVLLMVVEPGLPVLELTFEAVSAFSTTGHTMGLTARLSAPGQLVVMALMFIGRVGPFTLALAVSGSRAAASRVEYPAGRVIVG